MIRRHIVFTGSVLGVGFRYRARHAAELYGCTGWVRNEYDSPPPTPTESTQNNTLETIMISRAFACLCGRDLNRQRNITDDPPSHGSGFLAGSLRMKASSLS